MGSEFCHRFSSTQSVFAFGHHCGALCISANSQESGGAALTRRKTLSPVSLLTANTSGQGLIEAAMSELLSVIDLQSEAVSASDAGRAYIYKWTQTERTIVK
jgi:hypothetical protein